jgi:hypothetical protein
MKTRNIINWVLAGIIAIIFIGSALGKLTGNAEAIKMASEIGLDAQTYLILGVVEIIAVLLFLIPRTAVIGTLLLVAYLGGAIASHLGHAQSILPPVIISVLLWIVAFVRIPELSNTLLNKK